MIRVKFRSVLFPAALFVLAGFTPALRRDAPDSEVDKLLKSMRTAYQAADSASIRVKSRVKVGDEWVTSSVTAYYEKPNRLNMAFKVKDVLLNRVSDGRKVYTWVDLSSVRTEEVDADTLSNDAPINLEIMSFFDWKRQLSTDPGANMEKSKFKIVKSESWNGKSWIVLEESAHGQSVFVRYFIDPSTFMIWRCDVRDLDRKSAFLETEVVELTLNPRFDSDLFKAPRKPK